MYDRKERDKRELQKLYDKTKHSYGSGAWFDREKQRFIRYSPSDSSAYPKYLKRLSNKRVRKYIGCLPNGCSYRKLFDYWWELL